MSTHRRTWQKRESDAAALFGAKRQPGSGSSGRSDLTSSDSTHPRLYIETKLREKHAARLLLAAVEKKAKKEGKIPLLSLASKGQKGMVICCYASDLHAIASEALAASFAANAGDIDKSVHMFGIADELVRLSLEIDGE